MDTSFHCRQEIGIIREKSLLSSSVEAIISATASIATFLSILSLVFADEHVTPISAFMLLSFMNVLKLGVSVNLGRGLQSVYEAFVSLKRIEEFLFLDDLSTSMSASRFSDDLSKDDAVIHDNDLENKMRRHSSYTEIGKEPQEQCYLPKEAEQALVVSNLTYKLGKTNQKYILHDISFVTHKNSMTVITGQVGSGKSTLLSSIAGEVKLTSGTVMCPGTLAFVPQVPWVFSGTVRENILFGELYNHGWYTTVIDACALREDIERFPGKDETVVGERGIVLSGGQKARVSLARAVYSIRDVYLLDDPLSAVDQKVGEHIFEKCICGLLSEKVRVVASHNKRLITEADQVVLLDNGCTLAKGTLESLQSSKEGKGMFSSLSSDSNLQFGQLDETQSMFEQRYPWQNVEPPEGQTHNEPKGLVISDEDRAIGKVSIQLYWDYFKSGWHPVLIFALFVLFAVTQRK